jgi:hypothetical protein
MVVRLAATIGFSGLQPKTKTAINFSITLAALLPQKVHLVATLNCCDVIRHTHSWLTAQRGILSQQLRMAHGNSHQAPRSRARTHPEYPSTVSGKSYSHGQVARHFRCGAYVSSWLATPKWALTFRLQRHRSWRWSKRSPGTAQGGGAFNGPSGRQISTIMFAASSAYRSAFFMMRSSAVRSPKR